MIWFGDVLEGCPQLMTDYDDDIYMSVLLKIRITGFSQEGYVGLMGLPLWQWFLSVMHMLSSSLFQPSFYIIGGGRLEFPPSFFPSAQNALGDIVDNQMFISPLYGSWMKMTCIQHIQHNYSDWCRFIANMWH